MEPTDARGHLQEPPGGVWWRLPPEGRGRAAGGLSPGQPRLHVRERLRERRIRSGQGVPAVSHVDRIPRPWKISCPPPPPTKRCRTPHRVKQSIHTTTYELASIITPITEGISPPDLFWPFLFRGAPLSHVIESTRTLCVSYAAHVLLHICSVFRIIFPPRNQKTS